ncbi:MAG: putative DNA binding domain-containing protein, partial [Deltaproteobacteria bacterium]|nr:putative DNA binding domain-containing protein [Deltaproteobacteria bacterium]
MTESQIVEFKESWRDEYLKHICAFSNTEGGTLFIGIKDNGEVVRVKKVKKLLEDIPNKVVQVLGVTVSAQVKTKDYYETIEISVPASSVPISLYGKFYVRSGSTVQELKGHELRDFILRKDNITWDEIIVPGATLDDLDKEAIIKFAAKAANANRLPYEVASDKAEVILRNLDLINEKDELTRAAVLLFRKRSGQYIRTAIVKIGRFGESDADLISHDVIEGNLFEQVDNIMDILRIKYLHSIISYEGLYRKETLEYPEDALREAILNAIVHRDYGDQSDITIKVFNNRIVIWNSGTLIAPLNIEKLMETHPSKRRNSLVANAFFRTGQIEAWGRGIKLMINECKIAKLPNPTIEEHIGGILVTFFVNATPT